jgi:NAD(P)-dependent dehydrogenase (short-subunit alcohol dehydrogenase family)
MPERVAFVTGAAAGIGRAAAEALAARGARVVLVDREEAEPLDGTSVVVRADVSVGAEVASAVQQAIEAFGRLDAVVCAAGVQRYGSVVDAPESQWDEVLDTNLKQIFLVGKAAVPHLEAAGGGAIVNVASVQAFAAQRGVAAYAASKGGVVALTRAMAVDHAPTIRVNCVCPGSVDTPMLRWAAGEFGDGDVDDTIRRWGEMHPLGRVASAREVGEAIAFLVSPDASFITGTALVVDGGLLSQIGGT